MKKDTNTESVTGGGQMERERTSKKRSRTHPIGTGWAWKFKSNFSGKWILCHYAEPFLTDLREKPTQTAEAIRVAIVPIGVWRARSKARKDAVNG